MALPNSGTASWYLTIVVEQPAVDVRGHRHCGISLVCTLRLVAGGIGVVPRQGDVRQQFVR